MWSRNAFYGHILFFQIQICDKICISIDISNLLDILIWILIIYRCVVNVKRKKKKKKEVALVSTSYHQDGVNYDTTTYQYILCKESDFHLKKNINYANIKHIPSWKHPHLSGFMVWHWHQHLLMDDGRKGCAEWAAKLACAEVPDLPMLGHFPHMMKKRFILSYFALEFYYHLQIILCC